MSDETPSPNLSTMPPTVLDLVLRHSNFEAIQILRKVCHPLRSHIDNTHIDSKLQQVIIWENPPGIIWSEIHFDEQKMKIKYKKEQNGCLVKCKDNEKLLENQDFGTVAGHDLGLILKQQKTKMEAICVEFQKTAKLRLSFECLETTILQRGPPNSLTADENCYEFDYRHFKDKKQFIDKFGRPYRENDEGNSIWFYTFPGNDDRVLNISWCEKGKEFSCFAMCKSDMVDF
ncbi:hypothetical protein CAEBREN_06826 [Caenorhabditis brenneri]|uniref:F-box domain-containing protein n=1 Tax=Caenorhabditis brenneri TaxID=135651 RepID=G0NJD6_CAEBE|nr:hypothetical protein CAEBREN_06826 [Caenorhabditis brenneri]